MPDQPTNPSSAASLLLAADQARLTYDNAGALAQYDQALSQPGLPSELECDLRLGRARVLQAIGRLDDFLGDARRAVALAETGGDLPRQARALSLLSLAYGLLAQGAESQQAAERCLALAQQLDDAYLEAEARLRLSVIYFFRDDLPAGRQAAEAAVRLGRESGHSEAEAGALGRLGIISQREGQMREAKSFLEQAIAVARRAGDRRQEALGLNLSGILSADRAEQRGFFDQVLSIYQAIDEQGQLPTTYNNLALTYLYMGLYGKALRFARRAVSLAREHSGPVITGVLLETLARCEWTDPERARAAYDEALQLSSQRTDIVAFSALGLGRLALAQGSLPEARQQLERARTAFEAGSVAELDVAMGWVAMERLAEGDWAEADRLSAQAVDHLSTLESPGGTVIPQELWWCRYQVLAAQPGGPDADALWAVLERGRQSALTSIANLSDAGLRRNSLNKVPFNRDLLAAWANMAAQRTQAKRPRRKSAPKKSVRPSARAQKVQAANLQEQFKRLLEIGTRLNELGDAEALPSFIIDELVELTGAERAALVLVDRDGGRRVHAAHDSTAPLPADLDAWLPLEAGPVMDAARLPVLRLDLEDTANSGGAPELRRRSALAAPLVARSQVRGWLYVDNRDLFGPFGQDDLDLFSAFANQAATALENAFLIQGLEQRVAERTAAVEQRAAELAVINSVQQGLAAQLDSDAIYELVGDKIRQIFDAQAVLIGAFDAERGHMRLRYGIEKGERMAPSEPLPLSGIARHQIETAETLFFEAEAAPRMMAWGAYTMPGTAAPKSAIFVPLLSGGVVTGSISLQNVDREYAYTQADVRLLSTLGASLSVALENARLFSETKRLLTETEQRAAELAVINSVQQGLAAKLDYQAVIDLVGDQIRDIFASQDLSIRLIDAATGQLTYPYALENGQRISIPAAPLGATGFSRQVMVTRQPLLINERMNEREAEFGSFAFAGTGATQSWLGVPIVVGDNVIGVIALESFKEHAFSDSDVRLLSTLAASLGVALENARLFAETRRLLDETQQRAAELAVINSVQHGLVAQLDFQGVIDLVGDQLREIFKTGDLGIRLIDEETQLVHFAYNYEHGVRKVFGSAPLLETSLTRHLVETRQPLRVDRDLGQVLAGFGKNIRIPGTDMALSAMAVPIIARDRVIAVIDVESFEREAAFSDSDLRLLSTLAAGMGVALENARLFAETRRLLDETQQRNAELAVINSVQQGLVAQLDFQGIIDLVGDKLREVLKTDDIGIRMYDAAADRVDYVYEIEHGERLAIESRNPGGVSKRVLDSRAPLVINSDVMAAMGVDQRALLPGTDIAKSIIAVPILARGEPAGLIVIENHLRENAFSEADVRLLTTLASSMSVALQNANLFAETRRLLEETRQRAAELAVINTVQQGLAAQLDTQAIYELVGETLRTIFDAQVITITSYDLAQHLAELRFGIEDGQRVYDVPYRYSETAERLIATRQPLLANYDAASLESGHMPVVAPGTRAPKTALFVPLVVGDQVMGAVSLQNLDRQSAFGEAEVRLLTTLASSLSVALENARLFAETKRLLDETQQRNAELAVINSVQQGLVAQLDFQGIIDLVGDKLREVLRTGDIGIRMYDSAANRVDYLYEYEHGERLEVGSVAPLGLTQLVLTSRAPVVVNSDSSGWMIQNGIPVVPGTDMSKSLAAVPILARGEAMGVIIVENFESENAFSDADVRLLTTLASSMSVALQNAQLFAVTKRLLDETQQRNAELAIINGVGQALAAQLDPQAIFDLVGDKIREVFEAKTVAIITYDDVTNLMHYVYVFENGQRYEVPPEPLDEVGFGPHILRTRQPLMILTNLAERAVEFGSVVFAGEASKSYLGVPLIVGDAARGLISLQNTERENAFSESDQRLLVTLASSLSVAFENARLFAEIKRRAGELAALTDIGREISASLDLPTVLARITTSARDLLIVDSSAVFLLEPDGQTLVPIAVVGAEADAIRQTRSRLGVGLIGQITQAGRAEIVRDSANDPRGIQIAGTQTSAEEQMMLAPLQAGDRTIGSMVVWRESQQTQFGQPDLDFLTGLARQAAIAIQNARLFEQAQSRASETAALNQIGREISATLDQTLVLERIAQYARHLLAGGTSAVYLLEPDGQTLRVLVALGEIAAQVRGTQVTLGQGIIGSIARNGMGEYVNNTGADPRAVHIAGTDENDEGQKLMAVPLLAKEGLLGAMAIWRGARDPAFGETDLDFLDGLARQAAIAIQNARLFAEIQRQKDYAGALVENSPVAIVTTDLDTRVVSWNPGAEKLFGYSPEEAIGRSLDDLVAQDPSLHAEAKAINVQTSQARFNVITRRNRRDGSVVDVELSGVPVMVDGKPSGFIAIYHDISELQRARQEAETANQAKSAFLATMSHEIRTPMNAVIGMSGLLLDTPLSADQREFAEIIRSSSDSLLSIINDILDFSKIEAGKMDLEQQPFELRECIEGTLDLVANRAFEKGLDLAYELEDDLPPAITGDATRLRQILLNLLTNAVKFTDHGEVVLEVGNWKLEAGSASFQSPASSVQLPSLHFSVRDTGVGIAPDRMHRLFQSFSQVDASTARKYGGTGLGLAISKRLAEMMGGRMWAESAGVPGQGSSFHFTIQAPPALGEPAAAPAGTRRLLAGAQPQLENMRVLIVDDNVTNRRILTLQTEKWGMRPRDTGSPREALGWIERGDPFDVAILDMHMPELDGVALAGAIRRHPSGAALPLVLFTSLGRREMDTGGLFFAAHISKPIKPSQLFDALTGVFAGRHGGSAATPAAPAERALIEAAARPDAQLAQRHPLRLLLAEDNPVNQKLALRLLGQMGYRADVAGNGLEVLDALVRQPYDVVLMDVQMPEMDGLEASRQINQRWPRAQRPRIIAMTANAMAGDREMCLAAGMDDYLTKPIRVPQLVAALENSRPRPAPGDASMTEPAVSIATLDELVATTDRDFVRELIDTYLDDSPRLLAEMRQGLVENQPSTVQRAAHSLKSNSASLGAHALSAQAKELEQAAKAADLSSASIQIDHLAALYAQAETELRTWKSEG